MLMMMHRQFAVLTSQYPKQPLQHGRDEDEGGTPSHHTAAGIKSHNKRKYTFLKEVTMESHDSDKDLYSNMITNSDLPPLHRANTRRTR